VKIEKPLTDNIKSKANALYEYLKKENRYVTKEEIGAVLGIKNERSVRDVISLLATRKPILSKSNSKGYKLAQSLEDLEDCKNVWLELDSRIEELEKRREPIIKFYEKVSKMYELI
jgi:hypothetical protein